MKRVLLFAGTTEATALADRLHEAGYDVISSFAGVTRKRRSRAGRMRVGGFGGAAGLHRYLADEGIDVVVDATHPFAARMPFNARDAAAAAGVARCRVLRPAWAASPGDRWVTVGSVGEAPGAVRRLGARRVLLTVGRQGAAAFVGVDDVELVVRSIEAPTGLPPSATVILDQGPFDVHAERQLMVEHRVDAVVAKNSGGTATAAKLVAARALGLPVVMIDRPAQPDGPIVGSVDEALDWVRTVAGREGR